MWRKPTEEDLQSVLSQKEVEAFRKSADFTADPVPLQMANTVEFVRGRIRAAGVRLSREDGTLPASLIVPAMCYLRFNYLTRIGLKVSEDRRKAYEDALAVFADVAAGRMAVEPADGDEADDSPLSPAFAAPTPSRMLD